MPKTRFLIISDTHNRLPFPAGDTEHAYRYPFPRADVLLHCGDLTMRGGLDEYRSTLKMLSSTNAELKLVIAGNHDRTLDQEYWKYERDRREDEGDHEKAVGIWKGAEAREAGVIYLEEGGHEFVLRSGAKFKIYTSPYTPEFCNWAFPYPHQQDRFNPLDYTSEWSHSVARNPIPSFPDVDIIMTHGPPRHFRDATIRGEPAGCPHLLKAVARARPRLHCFGHIHEGWGAEVVTWTKEQNIRNDVGEIEKLVEKAELVAVDHEETVREMGAYVDFSRQRFGESTLMVNAAVLTVRYKGEQAPWIVDLDLPTGREQ